MANQTILADSHKGLVLGCMNVRSIFNVIDLLKTTFRNSCFHILGFSETWLNHSIDSSLITIDNYVLHRQDRNFLNINNEIKKGGGLCLYINKDIKTKTLHLKDMNISCRDIESQWVELCHDKQKNVVVCNLYRPPTGDVDRFILYIEQCIDKLDLRNKDLIMCGDVNIDVLDKKNVSTIKLVELLSQVGLENYIKTPTRFSKYKNSCIDHVYSNSDIILKSGVLDVNISDHELVYIIRKKTKTNHKKCEFTGRSYVNYSQIEFERLLENSNWELFYENDNPDTIWNIF